MFVRNLVLWVVGSLLGGWLVTLVVGYVPHYETVYGAALVGGLVGTVLALMEAGPISGITSFMVLGVVSLLPFGSYVVGAGTWVNLFAILFNTVVNLAVSVANERLRR